MRTVARMTAPSCSLPSTVTVTLPTVAASPSARPPPCGSSVPAIRNSWMPPATRMARPHRRAEDDQLAGAHGVASIRHPPPPAPPQSPRVSPPFSSSPGRPGAGGGGGRWSGWLRVGRPRRGAFAPPPPSVGVAPLGGGGGSGGGGPGGPGALVLWPPPPSRPPPPPRRGHRCGWPTAMPPPGSPSPTSASSTSPPGTSRLGRRHVDLVPGAMDEDELAERLQALAAEVGESRPGRIVSDGIAGHRQAARGLGRGARQRGCRGGSSASS